MNIELHRRLNYSFYNVFHQAQVQTLRVQHAFGKSAIKTSHLFPPQNGDKLMDSM